LSLHWTILQNNESNKDLDIIGTKNKSDIDLINVLIPNKNNQNSRFKYRRGSSLKEDVAKDKEIENKSYIIRNTSKSKDISQTPSNKESRKIKRITSSNKNKTEVKNNKHLITERRTRRQRKQEDEKLHSVMEVKEDTQPETGSIPLGFWDTAFVPNTSISIGAIIQNAEIFEELDQLKLKLRSVLMSFSQQRKSAS